MPTNSCIICHGTTHLLEDTQIKVMNDVCDDCGFIYKQKEFHMSLDSEVTEYNKHNNSFESLGYVDMFVRLIDGFIDDLNIERKILEFGSGPGPVLKELLIRKNHKVFDYDPFYNPNEEYKNHKYQLITSTEVAEHFSDPLKEFAHLTSLLEDDGYLLIMTSFRTMSEDKYLKWWYRRDGTHISFYNIDVFNKIAAINNLKIVKHNDKNIILFQKL